MEIPLLPKQLTFLRSRAPELLLSGAAGAGKSRVLCYKVLVHAQYPGNLVGLFRKSRAALRATTLRTLLYPDGDLPPVLPAESYTHNKQEGLIQLHGGGDILYLGFDDELRLGSLGLGLAAVDEGIEISEDEYTMLNTRLRNTADPCPQLVLATNPGPPSHYLYKRFFGEAAPDREVIRTNSLENTFLRPDYIRRLMGLTGVAYRRLVLGEWAAYEGLIFGSLTQTDCEEPWKTVVLGIDAGYRHPHAVLVAFPSYGAPHAVDELRGEDWTEAQFISRLTQTFDFATIHEIYVDPESPGLREALQAAVPSAFIQPAANEVLPGIDQVLTSTCTIGSACPVLREECLSYRWHKTDERPVKLHDHGPDALRYAIHSHLLLGAVDMRLLVT